MEGGGKKVVVVIVLVVAALVITWAVRSGGSGGPRTKEQQIYLSQEVELVDEATFAVMTKTRGQWEDLGKEDGKYKNPDTGTCSMVRAMTCGSCAKKIPQLVVTVSPDDENAQEKADEIRRKHMCPICGKPAFPMEE